MDNARDFADGLLVAACFLSLPFVLFGAWHLPQAVVEIGVLMAVGDSALRRLGY